MAQDLVEDTAGKNIMDVLRKLYSDYQGDNSEKMALFLDDGQMLVFGGREPHQVSTSLGDVIRALARRGKQFANVTNIVHNHNRGERESNTDLDVYKVFRKYGFAGAYQLYDPERRRLKTVMLKEK